MAQADGVVANGTGSAVRSDINGQYAALWSNHSGSTEPSTGKVAYQFWADTNTNILKIRNSANNGWINLFTLAGGIDVDAASNFNEDVTFTGASYNLVWDKSDNSLEFADNAKCTFGAGDLSIYHDGTHSRIVDNGANATAFQTDELRIHDAAANEYIAKFVANGGVELYYNNAKKFHTISSGTVTTGHHYLLDSDKLKLGDSEELQIYFDGSHSYITNSTGYLHINSATVELKNAANNETTLKATQDGAVELYYNNVKKFYTIASGTVTSGHHYLVDNNKLILGSSDDFSVYHDGTHSYLDNATGNLHIRGNGADDIKIQAKNGEQSIVCHHDGAVELYFDNIKRLETLTGGVQMHGDVTASGIYNNTTSGGGNVRVQSSGLLQRDTSSRRYKNSITDAVHGLVDLKKLRSVTFKGNNDGDTIFGGLIAEEVHDAGLTEFVDYNDNNQPEALCYGNMVSLCIKAIQELAAEVETLKTKVAVLEAK